ncbi:hypothetical protein ACWD7F_37090 [Streptomyces sp. NPDC005122]
MVDQGRPQRPIARELGLSRNTVRRFARAATWQELVTGKWQCLPGILDDFKPYLHQRWNEDCTAAATLFEEITAAGYRGGLTVLRDYLRPLRSGAPPREKVRPPSVRQVTGWITRHPDSVTLEEALKLEAILARCADLDATAGSRVRRDDDCPHRPPTPRRDREGPSRGPARTAFVREWGRW